MTPADYAFVGLVVIWILIVLIDNERCCPVCARPESKCTCTYQHFLK